MKDMKKLCLLLTLISLSACQKPKLDLDGLQQIPQSVTPSDSYTLFEQSTLILKSQQKQVDAYSQDMTIQVDHTNQQASFVQNTIKGDQNSVMKANYYDGKLYNQFNGVMYQEDMQLADVEAMIVLPTTHTIAQDHLQSFKQNEQTYTFSYDADYAYRLFQEKYDLYGITQNVKLTVLKNTFEDTYDEQGMIQEIVHYELAYEQNGQKATFLFDSTVKKELVNQTIIRISDEQRQQESAYVPFQQINVDQLPKSQQEQEGNTPLEQFAYRLVNRLAYVDKGNQIYESTFNDHESYRIDLNNKTFTYRNYSIDYTYNWKNDLGVLDQCTYNFKEDFASSQCKTQTVETIQKVKQYFEMEVEFCSLNVKELE